MTFIDQLLQIDGNLLIGIQHSLNADWLTPIMKAITFCGEYGWLSILMCLVLMAVKRTRKVGILCSASVLLTFIIVTFILKPSMDRLRPWEVFPSVVPLIPDPGDSSFPSGHASNAMAAAFSLWLHTEKGKLHSWSWVAIIFALLIGLSRLYLGMHFPSDVLIGMLVAIVSSQIIYLINIKLEAKRGIISE